MSAVAVFEDRSDPGELFSYILAALVHVLLAAVLVLGVRWQNRPPDMVSVELWEAPREAPPPPPVVEPRPEPKVETPAPPKPEPRIEKPDIEVKAPLPKPKPELKPAPKPEPVKALQKPPPPRPSDVAAQKRLQEELAREQVALATERERAQIRDQLARDAAAASARARAGWIDKIRAKIRGNILLPADIKGNPEAIFDVVQLPTGEVLSVKLRKSSGHAAYDEAVERAILKSSPLPRPERPELFQRSLELKFRPLDAV